MTSAMNPSSSFPIIRNSLFDMLTISSSCNDRGHSSKTSRTSMTMNTRRSNSRNSAIAGYIAGLSGTVVGYPLDSAKVWIQTGGCRNKHLAIHSTGGNGSSLTMTPPSQPVGISRILQTLRALYSGVSGPLVTVGIVQSINFAVYDTTRQAFYQREQERKRIRSQYGSQSRKNRSTNEYLTKDSLSGVAIAGCISGMATACVTAPLVMIKTNQQVTGNSFRQAIQDTLFVQGRLQLGACAAGFLPHILSESLGRSLYYVTYEGLKRSWSIFKQDDVGSNISISLQERMVCAAMSGILCWATIFPLDSLRSRLYSTAVQNSSKNHATSSSSPRKMLLDTIGLMYRERSFYRGFWVTVLRAGPVAAAVLPVYDLTLETLTSNC